MWLGNCEISASKYWMKILPLNNYNVLLMLLNKQLFSRVKNSEKVCLISYYIDTNSNSKALILAINLSLWRVKGYYKVL